MDRLSDLPDSILCHILSFLPTETSVATSILARRWKFLWAYVPNIDFTGSDEDFAFNKNPRIIDRVLLFHKLPSLRSVSIDLRDEKEDCDDFQMETWIFAAIHRNVEYLHLLVPYSKPLPFPLFTCKTLVGLRLYWCGKIPTLEHVCLPCLKKLHLQFVEFEDDKSLPCLLSGSPVLEYLEIEALENDDEVIVKSYYVSSPTVKWLCLIDLVGREGGPHRLEINAPALEYLSVHDTLAEHIKFGDLTSIITADIYDRNESEYLLKFLDSLCNVKCLKLELLSCYTAINDGLLSLWTPSFNNLTKLQLVSESRFLSKFLQNANNLNILEFWGRKKWRPSREGLNKLTEGWIEPQQVPKCLLSCLRAIKIHVDKEGDLEIIKYLLRNAQVLKKMDITYLESIDSNLLQKISLFERGSKTCELAFTETDCGRPRREIIHWD